MRVSIRSWSRHEDRQPSPLDLLRLGWVPLEVRWIASKLMQHGHRTTSKLVLGWAEYLDYRRYKVRGWT